MEALHCDEVVENRCGFPADLPAQMIHHWGDADSHEQENAFDSITGAFGIDMQPNHLLMQESGSTDAEAYLKGALGLAPQNDDVSSYLKGALGVAPRTEVKPVYAHFNADAPLPPSQAPALEGMDDWLKIGLGHRNADVPPPPSQPPKLDASCGLASVPPPPLPPTCLEPASDSAPVLCLVDALPVSDLGVRGMLSPSIGSQGHALGCCKPCTFFHTRGCDNGDRCEFCHLCGPGEKRRRLREKRSARREARAQFHCSASATD